MKIASRYECVKHVLLCSVAFFFPTAKSSFFDISKGAVDSPDPLKETEKEFADGSCPVLAGDTEAEAVRVLC